MSYRVNLESVDVDGAVREAAEEVAGDTRLDFLRKGAVGGGAVFGGAALMGAVPELAAAAGRVKGHGRPPAKFGKGDIGILNYALTLEYLESAFYNEATANGKVTDPETQQFLQVTTHDENVHVQTLKKVLGAKAAKRPKFDFKGTTNDQTMFQKTALALENTGVHAYSGQALNIKAAKVVKAALSIVTVEARHASVIGRIVNGAAGIAPDGAFDTPFTAQQVLAAVGKTGFIVG